MFNKRKEKETKKSYWSWIIMLIIFIAVGFGVNMSLPKIISHERVIDVTTLKTEITSIRELATVKYDYREVISKEKDGTFSNMFIGAYDGIIKAGINMDEIKYEVVNPEKESDDPPIVNITLPDAEILSHEDRNSKTIYQEGYASTSVGDDRNNAIQLKKEEKETEFVQEGNLQEAKQKAEKVIEEFIHSSYGTDVVVNFK